MKNTILFVAHSGTLAGGGERSLLDMVLHTSGTTDHKTHVALPFEGDFSKALKEKGIPYTIVPAPFCTHPLPDEEDGYLWKSVSFSDAMSDSLSMLLKIRPDLIIVNTIVNPWVARIAKLFNTPSIVCIRELFDDRNGVRLAPNPSLYLATVAKTSESVIYNSKFTRDSYNDFLGDLSSVITHPAIEISQRVIDESKSRTPLNSSGAVRLLFLGNIAAHKRPLDALKALNYIVENRPKIKMQLTIMGSSDDGIRKLYIDEIKSYIKDSHLDTLVSIEEFSDNPFATIIDHDILLMTSNHEGFGRVTREAQLLGRVVIGADAGGTLEIIDDGKTGYLYPSKDVAALAEKILYCIDHKQEAQAVAARGQEVAIEKNESSVIYAEYDELINAESTYASTPNYDEKLLFGDPIYSLIMRNRYMNDKLGEYATSLQAVSTELQDLRSKGDTQASLIHKFQKKAHGLKRRLKKSK